MLKESWSLLSYTVNLYNMAQLSFLILFLWRSNLLYDGVTNKTVYLPSQNFFFYYLTLLIWNTVHMKWTNMSYSPFSTTALSWFYNKLVQQESFRWNNYIKIYDVYITPHLKQHDLYLNDNSQKSKMIIWFQKTNTASLIFMMLLCIYL